MSATINRRITLAARPQGAPKPGDFAAVDDAVPAPGDGEMLLRTVYLSLDPYMRVGRMNVHGRIPVCGGIAHYNDTG